MERFPPLRLHLLRDEPPGGGDFVLYWMVSARRTQFNFGLQRVVDWATALGKPLVVLEPLRCDYPWASDRLHQFVLQGMADNAARLATTPVAYYPYLEPMPGAGRGLLAALAARACLTVTDLYPAFFLPAMVAAAARDIPGRFEQVDSNGLLPIAASERVFPTAHAFRRHLQKALRPHLVELPRPDPIGRRRLAAGRLPAAITRRWRPATAAALAGGRAALAALPIDHRVPPAPLAGGARAASALLESFVTERLSRYASERDHPDRDAASGLSPYLHFGHLGAHQVFRRLMDAEGWELDRLGARADGKRTGWWGMSAPTEAFLDQLVTWRELGFNMCALRPDHREFESLPPWARRTLEEHAGDPRPSRYDLAAFEAGRTHDPLWNASQAELRRDGRIQSYLRMLWGKKILEWSDSPREALAIMLELNDRYALDGRDPNSVSGIFWVLGRYDRAWGPERPIYGNIRYMTSDSARRKLRLRRYLERYGAVGS
jgi:deoxyribodipyrimidine photo-lyase